MRTHNNTDGNKLVIFSGIALYYGDNGLSYEPSISSHIQTQHTWLVVPDTDSRVTCSKKYSFL